MLEGALEEESACGVGLCRRGVVGLGGALGGLAGLGDEGGVFVAQLGDARGLAGA